MNITAVILAGGLGTRLRSLVNDLPKPMAPILGRPFLEYLIDYWISQGVNDFILSVGYKYKDIVSHFGNYYKTAKISYVIEESLLGTGGGVILAVEKIGMNKQFLLLNGDTFFKVDLMILLKFHQKKKSELTFSLFKNNDTFRYMGMNINKDGSILQLKSGNINENSHVNGGVYLIESNLFSDGFFVPGNKYSFESDLIPYFLSKNRQLNGVNFDSSFIDIGVPDDYLKSFQLFKSKN
jgi:D-glycero-alpha-D-manno-heptose 1-phosphate guanylyltransferase